MGHEAGRKVDNCAYICVFGEGSAREEARDRERKRERETVTDSEFKVERGVMSKERR